MTAETIDIIIAAISIISGATGAEALRQWRDGIKKRRAALADAGSEAERERLRRMVWQDHAMLVRGILASVAPGSVPPLPDDSGPPPPPSS